MPEDLYEYSDGEYYIKIREYERMTKFNDSIVFTIDEAGAYELYVNIDGYTEKRYYGGSLSFKFYITVTAGENYD
ncbi:MAG: hypothetical protein SO116_02785 [Treponema sp.]|nr:hypothetical protein [Treponema sp.]